ncbi:hypothetical protein ACU686_43530 [Yinghuangia aomiensis]
MAYEVTVIAQDGSPVVPTRIPAAQVPAALARAAANGTALRIRPIARAMPVDDDRAVEGQPS